MKLVDDGEHLDLLEDQAEVEASDVLWDEHDEQEQIETYQKICSSTTHLHFDKVSLCHSTFLSFLPLFHTLLPFCA